MSKGKENENEADFYLIYKNDIQTFPSLKRELIYNISKDKYYLYEKDSNKFYPSNFLGKKKIIINSSDLGKLSYKERLNKNLIEKIDKKFDDKSYHPKIKFFDGFSQIPRTLVQPFFNFNNENININIQNKNKKKKIIQSKGNIINYIKNKESLINDPKNKEVLSRNNYENKKEEIKGLNYFSNSVADTINSKNKSKEKKQVIKNINYSLNSEDLSKRQKNSLKKFKNNLLINSNEELKHPNKIFKNKYQISSNVMLINPLKYSKSSHDLNLNLNTYRILYKSINNNPITKLIERSSYGIKNRNKNLENRNYRPNSVMNFRNENKIFLPEKRDFKKRESSRYDTEEYKKDFSNNKKNIHSLEKITNEFSKEKKYISGYIKPLRKQNMILRKGIPKFISRKELYKKELDLFKLVNPQKLKMEEDENEKRDNYLKRKIENDRKVKIVKYKNNIREKASRITSAISNLAKDLLDSVE